MRTLRLAAPFLLVAACTGSGDASSAPAPKLAPPTGAKVEASGFASVTTAPTPPYPDAPPPSEREAETQRIAREKGISVSEAESRMNPDESAMRAAMALERRIKAAEGSNFVGVRIVRDPSPRYAFQFRKDGETSLARYTADKRFVALEGGKPTAELQPLFDEWFKRLAPHRLAVGGSVNAFEGAAEIDLGVSRPEFEAIAARENWRVPPEVKLGFAREIDPATAVSADAAPFVRVFARADRSPGAVLSIAQSGRIVLRDGCFRVDDGKGGGPLAFFGREATLSRDADGYLVIGNIANPDNTARVGETMIWGGYPAPAAGDPALAELRARCGEGPIASVGEPVSAAQFRVRAWAIDSYAGHKGISRQQAWNEMKACWAEEDARIAAAGGPGVAGPPRQCDVPGASSLPPRPPK